MPTFKLTALSTLAFALLTACATRDPGPVIVEQTPIYGKDGTIISYEPAVAPRSTMVEEDDERLLDHTVGRTPTAEAALDGETNSDVDDDDDG